MDQCIMSHIYRSMLPDFASANSSVSHANIYLYVNITVHEFTMTL